VELLARAGVDVAEGLQVVGLDRLAARPFDPSLALLVLPPSDRAAAGVADDPPLPGRHGHGADPVALLQRLYPADHPLLSTADDGLVGSADARVMSSAPHVLPALAGPDNMAGAFGLAWLVNRLRQPDGCPWDREQDHLTLRPFLLEETYEVYDALEGGATPDLAEELGDLLLQVVLHAQLAAEAGVFDMADVQASIARKIVRRHPHVFGDAVARTAADVNRQWERIKAGERETAARDAAAGAEGVDASAKSALDGISASMPALAAGQEMQERAAALGYDWPDVEGVLDKVAEELAELASARGDRDRQEEFGDLLLVVVNVARKLGIESEAALRAANQKFRGRFRRVERMVAERGVAIRDLDFAALDVTLEDQTSAAVVLAEQGLAGLEDEEEASGWIDQRYAAVQRQVQVAVVLMTRAAKRPDRAADAAVHIELGDQRAGLGLRHQHRRAGELQRSDAAENGLLEHDPRGQAAGQEEAAAARSRR
jgi:tetrapyrrole methylase family protein/MazG family protein